MKFRLQLFIPLLIFSCATLLLILLLSRFPYLVTLTQPPTDILKSTQNRTNILLLGLGGAGHEAPDLTDSLIFVSLNSSTKDVVLISLPRDIWIPQLRTKINAVYYYGNQKYPGGGLALAKTTVSQLLGQPVHYAAAINFVGFTQAIDLIGGIDVNVPQAFDDYQYPIPGKEADPIEINRYESLHFNAGLQHFDAPTALKYVRSRNAQGEQGSDFARSQRQQQLVAAFRQKLLSPQTLLKLNTLPQLINTFSDSVTHDFTPPELVTLAKLGFKLSSNQFRTGTLDTTNLLSHPPTSSRYDSQWVLIPQDSQQLNSYVTNLIFSPPPPPTN